MPRVGRKAAVAWEGSLSRGSGVATAGTGAFELPIDLRHQAPFSRAVLNRLARVPYGQVTTYGALAAEAHRPKAARAVGTVMNRNPVPIVLPCHRVVGANGSLTGYGGGLARKELLLKLEGALQPTLPDGPPVPPAGPSSA